MAKRRKPSKGEPTTSLHGDVGRIVRTGFASSRDDDDVQRLDRVEKQPYDWTAPIGALEGFLAGEPSETVVRRHRDE